MDIAWVLGNLGSGPPSHVDALVGAGAVGPLVATLEHGAFDLKREAAMALWQLCKDGRHLTVAVEAGALPLFLGLIRLPDTEVARLGLSFTQVVLDLMKGGVKMVEEQDGIDAIESVQYADDEYLSGLSNFLVNKYYGEDYGLDEEEEDDDGELPPWRRPAVG